MPDAPEPREATISLTDWRVILAGIKQFGLAPDGSDLRDLAAACERLEARTAPEPPAAILRRVRKWMTMECRPAIKALALEGIHPCHFSKQFWHAFLARTEAEKLHLLDLAIALAECAEGKRKRFSIAAEFGIAAWDISDAIKHRLLTKGTLP